jgi:hypothetical protein
MKTKKGKARADPTDSDSDVSSRIQVTLGKKNAKGTGIYVDEVIHLLEAPECWDVPPVFNRVAYILDFTATPECLEKQSTVDAFIKKQARISLL